MYKLIIGSLLLIIISGQTTVQAQNYIGKYRHQPHLNEFNHLIILQNPKQKKNNKVLDVRAIANSGELWNCTATPSKSNTTKALIERFGANIKIKTVYILTIPYKSEKWQYFLLEYKNDNKKDAYLLVENDKDEIEARKAVNVHTFKTDLLTASR